MNQPDTFGLLVDSINKSTKLLEDIKELFVVHEKAMRGRELDQLEANNTTLAQHLLLLKNAFTERLDLQKMLCPELNEEAWDAYTRTLPENQQSELETAWNALDSALAEVKTVGQVNQQILRRGQRQIDDLVHILQGKGRTNKVYDQRGSSGHLNTQSTLGKA